MPRTATSTETGGNGALIGGLAVTQTVAWGILYYAFSVVLVPMQRELGWSRSFLVAGFTAAVVTSGLVAPVVGRHLDATGPRRLMAGGSAVGAALVLAWSHMTNPVAYVAIWLAIGLVMASVLYEPAFTVLAKRCAPNHRRAITIVTLAAGLASTIFQPITSLLTTSFGWRTALVVLAVALAAVTVPIHLAVLGGSPPGAAPPRRRGRPPEADRRFWTLTGTFAAVSVTSFGTSVLLVAYLVDHGWSLGRASLAGGTLGAMQLPGRLAFGPLTRRAPQGTVAATLFALPAVGVVMLLLSGGTAWVWPAVVVLGVSQGATTLLRATLFVDLYGTDRIGVLNGLASTRITVARALAPFATAVVIVLAGYPTAFLLLAASSAGAAVVAGRVLREAPSPSEVLSR